MPSYAYDGNVRFAYVPDTPGINDITGPTTAELNAGTTVDLSCMLRKGGWTGTPTFNRTSAGRACEVFNAEAMGTWSASPTGTFLRDSNPSDDTAWNTFEHGQNGYIVIRYGMNYQAAWADGQDVEVWPVQSSLPVMDENAENATATFQVGFAATSAPELKAVVGGGS